MGRKEYVNISIPKELYKNVEKIIKGTGFRSVTEYIIFVTREALIGGEEGRIRERLRKLGYLE
ncbi:MAG: CopG family transcriptional regulator [Methanobacteriota archaeon]|nr:MAG: CopG family transcriptional regulator [Euryarchaeota archaeon]